jgi:GR25 family glycosyltransferase involved in LPS biosynthesis
MLKYKDKKLADAGFIINLPERVDRREEVIKKMEELGITGYEFVDGVKFEEPEWIRYGCTQSFINIFNRAIENNYESIIIFEDDITQTDQITKEEIDKIFEIWEEQIKNYDLIALGTRPLWDSKVIKDSEYFGTITNCLCAHAFFYKKEFIKYIVENLSCFKDESCPYYKVVIDEFISDCCSHNEICKIPNRLFKVGITIPMMFSQKPSYSDNERGFVNFQGWIQDSFYHALINGDTEKKITTSKVLTSIGAEYQTDKVSHGFTQYYETLLGHLRNESVNFLEIGVFYGSSIRMWRDYFANGIIYGIDTFKGIQGNGMTFNNPTDFYDHWKSSKLERVELIKCDQSKKSDLKDFVKYCKKNNITFDVILDDGSHMMRDQQISMGILFELVKDGGYYIVEDIHSSDCYPCEGYCYDVEIGFTNTTKKVLLDFKDTKKLISPYINKKSRIKYLESSIDSIEHFTAPNNQSQVITIKKK